MKKQFKPKKAGLIFIFILYMFLLSFLFILILIIPTAFLMFWFDDDSFFVLIICFSVISGIITAAYVVFHRMNITIEVNDYEVIFIRGSEKFKIFPYAEYTFNIVFVKPSVGSTIVSASLMLILINIPIIGWFIPTKKHEKYIEMFSKNGKKEFKYDCLRFSDKDFEEMTTLIKERTIKNERTCKNLLSERL